MITLAQLPPSVQVTTMTEINPTMEAWNLIFESQADIEVEEAFDRGISFRDFESFFSYEFTYRTEFMNNPGVSRLTHWRDIIEWEYLFGDFSFRTDRAIHWVAVSQTLALAYLWKFNRVFRAPSMSEFLRPLPFLLPYFLPCYFCELFSNHVMCLITYNIHEQERKTCVYFEPKHIWSAHVLALV